jgi:hypothetical protein
MLKRFYLTWCIYWGVYLIQPVHTIFSSTSHAFFYQVYFVAFVTFGYLFSFFIFKKIGKSAIDKYREYPILFINRIIKTGYVLSLFGVLLLFIDKIFIQEIDFTQSIAVIRDQWQLNAALRDDSISSIYSAIGYLVGSSYYLCLLLLFSPNYILPKKRRIILILIGFIFLFLNSLLIGGRSGILLLISLVPFSYFSNSHFQHKSLFSSKFDKASLIIICILFVIYSSYIFELRAFRSGLSVNEYITIFMDSLGLQEYDFIKEPENWIMNFLRILNFIVSYLTHSFSTMAEIADYSGSSQNVIFLTYQLLLSKLNLMTYLPNDILLHGRLASLPGLLFLTNNYAGIFFGAFVLGFLSNLMNYIYRNNVLLVLPLIFVSLFESILILSPYLFSWDLIFFPFVISGGLITYILAKIKFKLN